MFFENLIPHKFLSEIVEVIEIMKVKKKDWFFIILFGDDDYFFEDQLGRYQNVTRKPVYCNTPTYVGDLIQNKRSIGKLNISFIWHPKKILNNKTNHLEEKIHFFWNLIHELQHLKQDETYGIGNTELYSFLGKYFIEKIKIKNTLEIQLLLPVELDAEKKAKKIKRIDSNDDFNVKKETLRLLMREKVSLKKKLKEFQDQGKYTDIDIDAICKSGDIWGK